jgi:hypothetical protein
LVTRRNNGINSRWTDDFGIARSSKYMNNDIKGRIYDATSCTAGHVFTRRNPNRSYFIKFCRALGDDPSHDATTTREFPEDEGELREFLGEYMPGSSTP